MTGLDSELLAPFLLTGGLGFLLLIGRYRGALESRRRARCPSCGRASEEAERCPCRR